MKYGPANGPCRLVTPPGVSHGRHPRFYTPQWGGLLIVNIYIYEPKHIDQYTHNESMTQYPKIK